MYIAISGNTGAGKSTLVKEIISKIQPSYEKVIGIDERELHHPFLKSMFSEPIKYSFGIQINFLLQRHLLLLKWLSANYTVVIERSHLDDQLFVDHHFSQGHISSREYNAYCSLAAVLNEKLPYPDIFICLDVTPNISMARLTNSESTGERPREFPNDIVKEAFISSWYQKYKSFHEKLSKEFYTKDTSQKILLMRTAEEMNPSSLAEEVLEIFNEQSYQ